MIARRGNHEEEEACLFQAGEFSDFISIDLQVL
jgi:hypothetical protein